MNKDNQSKKKEENKKKMAINKKQRKRCKAKNSKYGRQEEGKQTAK